MTSKPSPRSSASPSELKRALLARQWLLVRAEVSVPGAVEHLVGLQAQATPPPDYALAARLRGFTHADLSAPLAVRFLGENDNARATAAFAGARDVRFEPALPS